MRIRREDDPRLCLRCVVLAEVCPISLICRWVAVSSVADVPGIRRALCKAVNRCEYVGGDVQRLKGRREDCRVRVVDQVRLVLPHVTDALLSSFLNVIGGPVRYRIGLRLGDRPMTRKRVWSEFQACRCE